MVDELHKHDIEVILDVVYNHTGEGGFWRSKVEAPFDYGSQSNFDDKTAATIYSFRGLDNRAYYHLTELDEKPNHGYLDQTGVGNQMRTNHEPFRQLILDNLKYWVEEMHVDGFRFDLASILGVTDENPYNTAPLFGAITSARLSFKTSSTIPYSKRTIRVLSPNLGTSAIMQ